MVEVLSASDTPTLWQVSFCSFAGGYRGLMTFLFSSVVDDCRALVAGGEVLSTVPEILERFERLRSHPFQDSGKHLP